MLNTTPLIEKEAVRKQIAVKMVFPVRWSGVNPKPDSGLPL